MYYIVVQNQDGQNINTSHVQYIYIYIYIYILRIEKLSKQEYRKIIQSENTMKTPINTM